MTINVNGKIINVESSFDIVFDRLKQFEIDDVYTTNKLIIKEEYILINIDDKRIEINEKVNTTDIYPIVNNVIAYAINNKNNIYIHSVVISKNGRGILLLGEFNAGKTSLANASNNYGYVINSADQTWLFNDELVLGSSLNILNGKATYLEDYLTSAKVKIEKIVIIKGLCSNGDTSLVKLENNNHYIKNIFKYANWHYDMPLLTKYTKLIDSGEKILEYLKNINIPTYVVRGDENKIMEAIDDRKENIK